jgi:hypothetical protein
MFSPYGIEQRNLCEKNLLKKDGRMASQAFERIRLVTVGYLSFGPTSLLLFCDLSVREKAWRSRVRVAKATSALSTACSARGAS